MLRGLDFETFGDLDPQKVGLHNYVNHVSFRPLIAAVAHWDEPQHSIITSRFDFVTGHGAGELEFRSMIREAIRTDGLTAHNAPFERTVLDHMDLRVPPGKVLDSAVIARTSGASSKLDQAASQLLSLRKMTSGERLVKKFCRPQDNGYIYADHFDQWTTEDWDDWEEFCQYCELDASLSLQIITAYGGHQTTNEFRNELVTQQMNDAGWYIDLDLVKRMSQRYQENLDSILADFRRKLDPKGELNFRSNPQLQKWCKARGVTAKSFDKLHIEKMIARLEKQLLKLAVVPPEDPRRKKVKPYSDVLNMLRVKQALGGSSLSKLETIQRLLCTDGRLRHQYVHAGAGQTWRTSSFGVQIQNLVRLPEFPGDVSDLSTWTNEELQENLRQVFIAEDANGRLIVADFSSVESRGLAYLADAKWKLRAYAAGKDMYKVQACLIYNTEYSLVDKEQRRTGKIGELSCGYGAGGIAVKDFAEKMNVILAEDEAFQLVGDWRDTNPEITDLWSRLDRILHEVVEYGASSAETHAGPDGMMTVRIERTHTPQSVIDQRATAQTLLVRLISKTRNTVLVRWFQGCFMDGRDVCYMKPSELKKGKPWQEYWTKKNESGRYKLYGGKLAGILTQSFCRELFFTSARALSAALSTAVNTKLIGQFHDELIVEWTPEASPLVQQSNGAKLSLVDTEDLVARAMTKNVQFPDFPLEAEVHSARRYIK